MFFFFLVKTIFQKKIFVAAAKKKKQRIGEMSVGQFFGDSFFRKQDS